MVTDNTDPDPDTTAEAPAPDSQTAASVVEDSPWLDLFGDSARPRILLAMVALQGTGATKAEIARRAGIDASTLHRAWSDLEDLGVVEVVGKDRHKKWALADDHPAVAGLYETDLGLQKGIAQAEEGDPPADLE